MVDRDPDTLRHKIQVQPVEEGPPVTFGVDHAGSLDHRAQVSRLGSAQAEGGQHHVDDASGETPVELGTLLAQEPLEA